MNDNDNNNDKNKNTALLITLKRIYYNGIYSVYNFMHTIIGKCCINTYK